MRRGYRNEKTGKRKTKAAGKNTKFSAGIYSGAAGRRGDGGARG